MILDLAQRFLTTSPEVMGIAGPAVGGGLYTSRGIQSVPAGFVGLRTRFKNPLLPHAHHIENPMDITEDDLRSFVTPGRLPKFHWPLTHSICLVSTQDRTAILQAPVDTDNNSNQLLAGCKVTWGIKADKVSAFRAMFVPMSNEKGLPSEPNLVKQVESELGSGYLEVMQALPPKERHSEEIKRQMLFVCEEGLARYGAEIRRVNQQEKARTLGQLIVESSAAQNPVNDQLSDVLPLERNLSLIWNAAVTSQS